MYGRCCLPPPPPVANQIGFGFYTCISVLINKFFLSLGVKKEKKKESQQCKEKYQLSTLMTLNRLPNQALQKPTQGIYVTIKKRKKSSQWDKQMKRMNIYFLTTYAVFFIFFIYFFIFKATIYAVLIELNINFFFFFDIVKNRSLVTLHVTVYIVQKNFKLKIQSTYLIFKNSSNTTSL